MDDIEVDDKFSDMQRWLDEHEAELPMPYWLIGDRGGMEYLTLCFDCVKKLAPDADDYGDDYDGGFDSEHDGSEQCYECNRILSYTLTDYGVENELYKLCEAGVTADELQNGVTCFELARIAHGVYTDEQKRQFVNAMSAAFEAIA
jgi:hypothetical protein